MSSRIKKDVAVTADKVSVVAFSATITATSAGAISGSCTDSRVGVSYTTPGLITYTLPDDNRYRSIYYISPGAVEASSSFGGRYSSVLVSSSVGDGTFQFGIRDRLMSGSEALVFANVSGSAVHRAFALVSDAGF